MALTASNIAAWTKAISRSAGGPGSADATMATAVASQSVMTLAEADVIGLVSAKASSSFGRVVDIVSSRSIEAARLVGQCAGLEIGNLRLHAISRCASSVSKNCMKGASHAYGGCCSSSFFSQLPGFDGQLSLDSAIGEAKHLSPSRSPPNPPLPLPQST